MGLKQSNQNGRSMIEMLGVLAIVGILSVGGMSAYRKAMTKYEANKWTEDMQLVVENFTFYAEEWKRIARKENKDTVSVTKYVYDAGLVPSAIKQSIAGFSAYPDKIYISIVIRPKDSGFNEKCHRLFNQLILPRSEIVEFVHRIGKKDNDAWLNQKIYYGGTRCNPKIKCLQNFTITDVINICHYDEEEENVAFAIYFK
ncbi:MAG: type II secretion system protein [Alphaproteobacteria bacterium]|nr:type II secretion system protein [Alphaproteobacteria bacterium]